MLPLPVPNSISTSHHQPPIQIQCDWLKKRGDSQRGKHLDDSTFAKIPSDPFLSPSSLLQMPYPPPNAVLQVRLVYVRSLLVPHRVQLGLVYRVIVSIILGLATDRIQGRGRDRRYRLHLVGGRYLLPLGYVSLFNFICVLQSRMG